MADFVIIDLELADDGVVFGSKRAWSGVGVALVPDEENLAARAEDALEFEAGAGAVEPVEGLAGDYEIDGFWGKGRGFGGGADAVEFWEIGEEFFGGLAHGGVGFYAEDFVAVLEKEFGEESGAGADVGDFVLGAEAEFGLAEVDDGARIVRAGFDVVFDSVGETLGGIELGLICGHDRF